MRRDKGLGEGGEPAGRRLLTARKGCRNLCRRATSGDADSSKDEQQGEEWKIDGGFELQVVPPEEVRREDPVPYRGRTKLTEAKTVTDIFSLPPTVFSSFPLLFLCPSLLPLFTLSAHLPSSSSQPSRVAMGAFFDEVPDNCIEWIKFGTMLPPLPRARC